MQVVCKNIPVLRDGMGYLEVKYKNWDIWQHAQRVKVLNYEGRNGPKTSRNRQKIYVPHMDLKVLKAVKHFESLLKKQT